MSRVAHGAELGHKEVVAAVVGRRVLLNVGKLHELERRQEVKGNSCERRLPNNQVQVEVVLLQIFLARCCFSTSL